jgi:site-specific DNA-methyltransferase (adenine-specific)
MEQQLLVFDSVLSPTRQKSDTKANRAQKPFTIPDDVFQSELLRSKAYYSDDSTIILNMDIEAGFKILADHGIKVNCIVTSPPFYGQRDYGVNGQIGLEDHPKEFVKKLVSAFESGRDVLADNGSLWVNLGDTYWSGKGEHKSGEAKQNSRRFGLRPQDKKGDGKLCVPKQLLLLPHRFAIAMQDEGWIVRNDNVWVKPNPTPDQVRDRCSMSHEYVFHLVKGRWYYFDKEQVARQTNTGSIMPPLDTWEVASVKGKKKHIARFSDDLVRIPILSTTPKNGVVLDPFAGSGTSILFARKHGFRSIGIDISKEFCDLMVHHLKENSK